MLISEATQNSYNSEKSKIMGTGHFIDNFEILRPGMAQFMVLKGRLIKNLYIYSNERRTHNETFNIPLESLNNSRENWPGKK